ncbi:uncharacterized protein LOC123561699 [Mercenaria mercenaria]|uniref:uncharacterized protein LOC123561699 n=1 Tax=Mercenaria mercenaria TaxID=6596 RepID=UPI00234F55D4|nr:uncharacterized protein LOC123561699 [Mercenaria mercenaria]XP_045210178.2 uncharacterized protein LOC123561699 [Mercenaria mercenaria]
MSVRNQYARNYYKITPLPISSNHIANARNAARRRIMYRPPDEESSTSAAAPTSVTHGVEKKSNFSDIKSNRETEEMFAARKYDKMAKGNEVTMYGKRELNKLVSNCSLNNGKDSSLIESRHNKAKSKDIKANVSSQQTQKSSSNVTQSRPMSARPDSRWERRVKDEYLGISDEESDTNIKYITSLPGGKDSRKTDLSESEVVSNLQSRPKTSHGRQKSMDNNVEQIERKKKSHKIEHERPKSRIGDKRETKLHSDESTDMPLNLNKDSNQRQVSVRNTEPDDVLNDVGYHVGISTFYPDLVDKIHGIDDINLQIEDIDRDVDPVLFFMQDTCNSREGSAKKRSSLSKDAINVITNEKSSRQTIKPAIGFLGNNQNKRHSAPEVIDRFHGNRVSRLQNSIPEGNQRYFYNGRQERIKSDSGENAYKSRTNETHIDKSLSTGLVIKKDSEMGKQFSNYDGGTTQTYNVTTNRKPRKLKPIAPSCIEE